MSSESSRCKDGICFIGRTEHIEQKEWDRVRLKIKKRILGFLKEVAHEYSKNCDGDCKNCLIVKTYREIEKMDVRLF